VLDLGFDPIWFGVITVIGVEMGLITPPLGLNVFVIKGIAKDVPIYTIFRGILPFLFAMWFVVVLLTVFPQIALFLPSLM
jgi:TRAP-type C4-dicarboxylate transport system permease large subunit